MKYCKDIFLVVFILTIHTVVFLLIKDFKLLQDEYYHYNQIARFISNDYTLNPATTIIPGYHILIAIILLLFQASSLAAARLISFIFSLSSIAVFFLAANYIDRKSSRMKTLQYSLFPLAFPFFSLVYTDILSIFSVLLSFYFVLKRYYHPAGFIGIISLLVRQNNVIWLVFFSLFSYYQQYGFTFQVSSIIKHLKKTWFLTGGILFFAVFSIINQGFAVGKQNIHPTGFLNMGNIYLLLFLYFFLFLPANISNISRIFGLLRKHKVIIAGIPFALLIFLLTFINNHPFNQAPWFLHNAIVMFFGSSIQLKVAFFTVITFSVLFLSISKFLDKSFYFLYPFSIVSLLPIMMIEARYYLIPFSFYILFKREKSRMESYFTVSWYLLLSVFLINGILKSKFFP